MLSAGDDAVLPLWVRIFSLCLFPPIAFLGAWATARLCVALANPPPRGDEHWTEQAQKLYPRRIAFSLTLWAQLASWCFSAAFFGWQDAWWRSTLVALACAAAVLLGATLASMSVSRGASIAQHRFGPRLVDLLTSLVIRMIWLLIWILAALTLNEHPWLLAAAAALSLFAAWRGAGLYVARALGMVRPASARLQAIVARAALSTGVTPRAVFEARMISNNAFAFIGGGVVLFTDAALANLTDGELEPIAAHELGHLGEPRRLSLARFAPLLLMLIPLAIAHNVAIRTWTGVASLWIGMLLLVLLMRRLSRRIARRGETHADAVAHRAEAKAEPGTYARALEKIYRLNLMPVVLAEGTHPPLYDRMLASGVQPDYPRPSPQRRLRMGVAAMAILLLSAVPFAGLLGAQEYLRAHPPESQRTALLSLALIGPNTDLLSAAARDAFVREDYSTSAALYGEAGEHRPDHPAYPAYQARALMLARRCPEAAVALHKAQALLTARSSARARGDVDATAQNLADWCPNDAVPPSPSSR